MSKVLVLKSSILGEYSQSNKLLEQFIHDVPDALVRDLTAQPLPVLDGKVATALRAADADLTDEMKALVELSNTLVDELKTAQHIVIGAPMYNFMIPTQLKNWFDLIARAGVTFKYSESGVEGLVPGKKVTVVSTRGGIHRDTVRDNIHSYMTTMLGFIGITDVEFIYAEALNMGEEAAEQSLKHASEQVAQAI